MSALNTGLLPIIIVAGGLTYLAYLWGRRTNWRIIQAAARECEQALHPREQSYTWIGGLIGFRADYVVRRGHLNRVEATLTALPRHSLLYFPVSWAIRRHDTLYLLFRPNQPLGMRAHVYLLAPGSPAPRIHDAASLKSALLQLNGRRYRMLYGGEAGRQLLESLLKAACPPEGSARRSAVVRHLAINPDEGAVYCRMVARPGQVSPVVERLAGVVESL